MFDSPSVQFCLPFFHLSSVAMFFSGRSSQWLMWLLCALVFLFSQLYQPTLANNKKRSISADAFAKAFEHGARVRGEGSCQKPHPTIVYVNTTDPSKVYMPRATVLHRCSDLTGCCQHPSETCEAAEMTTVELYFLTLTLQVQSKHKNRRVRQSPKVETQWFVNHTRCECRERNSNEAVYDISNEVK